MNDATTDFYLQKDEPARSCLLALRDIVLKYDARMSAGMKYGMPLFSYNGKMFCYLWTDKKTGWPYILMVDGNKIEHPALVQGDRKRMKVLMINPNEDIPVKIIQEIFDRIKALHTH